MSTHSESPALTPVVVAAVAVAVVVPGVFLIPKASPGPDTQAEGRAEGAVAGFFGENTGISDFLGGSVAKRARKSSSSKCGRK